MSCHEFIPRGVCCKKIKFELDNNVVKNIQFIGGCPGNAIALSKVCEGQSIEKLKSLFNGIDCGGRGTSCADQLAKAIANTENK